MSSDDKGLTRKIRGSPTGRAITEAAFAVVFTFLPIVFLSIPFSVKSGAISWAGFVTKFYKFWDAGQLALPILGVSGTVAALAALNGKGLPQVLHTIAWLLSVALFLACGFSLAASNGFADPLNPGILKAGVWAYIAILIIWIIVSIMSESGSEQENSDERANKLLRALHGEGGDAE